MNQIIRRLGIPLAAGLAMLAVTAQPSAAMPNFSRQYGVGCSTCHTTIPRLNRTGYEFRRSGWRNPDEIGLIRDWEKNRAEETHNLADYFAARLQANASYVSRNHATDGGAYTVSSHNYTVNRLEFTEFTLYPLTGGFLGNWASMSEISGETDNVEVENAYVRYDRGGEKGLWEARIGVFHPFEGFGASDRPLGLSRPLIQSQGTVDGRGTKNGWHPWGFDEAGLEGGLMRGGTSLSAVVFNGLLENADDPAQSPGLRKAPGSPTENDKDFQVFFHQFLGKSDAAISAFYYRGSISLGPEDALHKDTFDRFAVYGTLPLPGVSVLGAYSVGSDDAAGAARKAKNKGWYAEADHTFANTSAVGARFDTFDPSDLINSNDVQALSAFFNYPLNNGLQLIAELRRQKSEKGVRKPDQTENSINVRFIYIW